MHDDNDLAAVALALNARPRKTLGWRTPAEALDGIVRPLTVALRRPLESARHAPGPYWEVLERHGIRRSVSRKGDRSDNAPMEGFFASFKKEQVHHARFRTREEAEAAVFEYVEIFSNRQRLHSAPGYRTPAEARAGMEGITMPAAA